MNTIAIVGSGNFGANAALHIAENNLAHVTLIDHKPGLAKGKALDLMEAAPVRGFNVNIKGSDSLEALDGACIVVIAAGASRKVGVASRDLFQENLEVMKKILAEVKQRTPEAIVIIQREPVAALAYRAIHECGFEPDRVIGMTGLLETVRMRYFMARALDVSPLNTTALVIGGPGPLAVPLVQYANVSGVPLTELLSPGRIEQIVRLMRRTEEEIMSLLRVLPPYYTPAAALGRLVSAIVRDQRRYLPVTVLARGQHGLRDVCVGLPALVGRQGVEKVLELDVTEEQKQALAEAAAQMNAPFV
jgi:malate dehydrogenase